MGRPSDKTDTARAQRKPSSCKEALQEVSPEGDLLQEAPSRQTYYFYVVECADGTWYTGYTVDVSQRLKTHNAGTGAKYTRARLPVRLVAQASFNTKREAMSAEYASSALLVRRRSAWLPAAHKSRSTKRFAIS